MDGDSGNSTLAHSPEGSKSSSSYIIRTGNINFFIFLFIIRLITHFATDINSSTGSTSSSNDRIYPNEPLEATHRGLHKFTPRHGDEIDIDIGDPIYVQTEADDCWCEGQCRSPAGEIGHILSLSFCARGELENEMSRDLSSRLRRRRGLRRFRPRGQAGQERALHPRLSGLGRDVALQRRTSSHRRRQPHPQDLVHSASQAVLSRNLGHGIACH